MEIFYLYLCHILIDFILYSFVLQCSGTGLYLFVRKLSEGVAGSPWIIVISICICVHSRDCHCAREELIVLAGLCCLCLNSARQKSAAAQIMHSPQGLRLSKLGVNGVSVQAALLLISLPSLVGGR